MLRRLSFSSALVLSSLALIACPPEEPPPDGGSAVDAGDDDVDAGPGEEGCGEVTALGECVGSVVTFCDTTSDQVITYDCADRTAFPDTTTECSEVSATWGVDCTVAPGGMCAYFTADGFEADFCRGTEPGCLESDEDFTCIENAGVCSDADVGTCDGNTLTWACSDTQPQLTDCASYGGTCDATTQACVGLPVGTLCDDELLVCAEGLDCQAGACVALPGEDAGPDAGADDDAGSDDDAGPVDAGSDDDAGSNDDAGSDAG